MVGFEFLSLHEVDLVDEEGRHACRSAILSVTIELFGGKRLVDLDLLVENECLLWCEPCRT